MKLMEDRGATAILIAVILLVLMGFAALAVDIGAGMVERRGDQTSADVAVMAGALEALNGAPAMITEALAYARLNLPTTYLDAQWQALWEGCIDPPGARNYGPYHFTALPAPPGWTPIQPADWCISFDSAHALLRVRVPNQVVVTPFGAAIGFDEIYTSAAAVARMQVLSPGGVLPFGLPSVAGNGMQLCLSSAPTGLSSDPCTGPVAGNFGTIKARQFGNTFLGYAVPNCQASPLNKVLAQNIAAGLDHIVVTDPDGLVANEVRDECFNNFVDTLNTDTGFGNKGVEDGLVGPVPTDGLQAGVVFTPRLKKNGPFASIYNGHDINDQPLWDFLLPRDVFTSRPDYGGTQTADTTDDAPASCDPATFNGNGTIDFNLDGTPDDFNADLVPDTASSWQHMSICFRQYVGDLDFNGSVESSPSSEVIFTTAILDNRSRFAYVPQFWEATLGTGSSWLHIFRFRAVYLQTTTWKEGNAQEEFHHPGENCQPACNGNGYSITQLSAYVFPDASLPAPLRGDPIPPSGGLNPFVPELFR
jgi:hypothetical protein